MPQPETTAPEYRIVPMARHTGRWIIAYARPLVGCENESVDATSYPSFEAALTAMEAL